MTTPDLSPVVNHLWQSTACGGAAWLLSLALYRNRAAVRYWLWLAVSLKFLVPFSALVALGGRLLSYPAPIAVKQQFAAAAVELSRPFTIVSENAPLVPTHDGASLLPALLVAIWLGGIGVGLAFWIRMACQMRAVRRAAFRLPLDLPVPALSAPVSFEPGVHGIVAPVLLLPEGITKRLSAAELDAVIAHEMCHVRRRDNLTAALHMAVETIFWFHPLVWWIRTRLLDERERACDEEVLGRSTDASTYAESILSVCRFYVESPAVVEGISGADLRKRIEAIVSGRSTAKLGAGRKLLLGCAAAVALAWPIALGVARVGAQEASPASLPHFEVASVKPTPANAPLPMGNRQSSGKVTGKVTLHRTWIAPVIQRAYGILPWELDGAPGWTATEFFDIDAEAPRGWTKEQIPLMLQAMLGERFQLKVHHEKRTATAFAMVVASGGIKMNKAGADASIPDVLSMGGENADMILTTGANHKVTGVGRGPFGNFRLTMQNGVMHYEYPKMTMTTLARFLSSGIVGLPVVDETSLKGEYSVSVDMSSADTAAANPNRSAAPGGADAPTEASEPTGASVFSSLRKLGLKLERRKEPVDKLVVDHIERPSAN